MKIYLINNMKVLVFIFVNLCHIRALCFYLYVNFYILIFLFY